MQSIPQGYRSDRQPRDVSVFLADPEPAFERIREVARENRGEAPYPNITAVGVTWLYGFQFEIKAVARIPD